MCCPLLCSVLHVCHVSGFAGQMATLEKAEALLEELRVASVEAARRDLEEVTAFAAEQAHAWHQPQQCLLALLSGRSNRLEERESERERRQVACFASH